MILHQWNDNILKLASYDGVKEITFPEATCAVPHFNKNKRYFAVGCEKNAYLYDMQNDTMIAYPYQKSGYISNFCFDSKDRVYFSDKGSIVRWDFKNQETKILYTFPRAIHLPEMFELSPNEKLLAFTRYKSSGKYIYVLNLETLECTELKFAVFNYLWIDNSHIAWSLSGGIKVLDLSTKKNKSLIKDYEAVYKKCNKADKEKIEYFLTAANTESCVDLIGKKDDNLIFALDVFQLENFENNPRHKGMWYYDLNAKKSTYIRSLPLEFCGLTTYYLDNDFVYASDSERAMISNGTILKEFDRRWLPVTCDEW